MKTFLFASLRGDNFNTQGETAEEAWKNLVEVEKIQWKCFESVIRLPLAQWI
jgi:hypothetical protein